MNSWRRLDPRALIIRPVEGLARAAVPLIAIFFSGGRGGPGQWISLAGAVLVVVAGVLHWFTTRYRIGASQVELKTGLVRRRHLAVPLDRVRSVDVTAHVLHRVLGVAVVKIGTGRRDKGKHDELRLDGVSRAQATDLRAELLHRHPAQASGPTDPRSRTVGAATLPLPQAGPEAGLASGPGSEAGPGPQAPAAAAEAVLSQFDPRWVRFAPFTLSGLATVGAIIGYFFHLLNEAHIDPGQVGEVRSFAGFVSRTSLPLLLVGLFAALLVLASALSTAGYLMAFWGFTLTRHQGGSLHVQRGLLTTRSVSLEERRLRGVEVREPLLLRMVRGARLIAIATGMRENRGSDRGGELLQPPAPLALTHRVAALVLRGNDPTTAALTSHGPAARRRRYVRAAALLLALVAALTGLQIVAGWPLWTWWLLALAVPAAAALAADRYRSLGHAVVAGRPPAESGSDGLVTHAYLVTRHGSVDRRTAALRTDAIIGWRIRQSFFQRRAGLATLTATTAGGHGAYHVPDVPVNDALACAEAALPGLLGSFVHQPGLTH